jgi:hypothetical protein
MQYLDFEERQKRIRQELERKKAAKDKSSKQPKKTNE